jgi:mannosyltransferase OCH1-like enzyme
MWWIILLLLLTILGVTTWKIVTTSSSSHPSKRTTSLQSPIPHLIHFMYGLWDNTPMPLLFRQNINQWRDMNPDYEVRIWGRKECDALVQQAFPQLLSLYHRTPRGVMKADMLRYCIVYTYGGYYFDLDAKCGHPIQPRGDDPLVFYTEIIMSREHAAATAQEPIRHGIPEKPGPRFANYAFGSISKHPFWKRVFHLLLERAKAIHPDHQAIYPLTIQRDYDVLYLTGPDLFTTAIYDTHHERYAWTLQDSARQVLHGCTGTWREE